jgi:hypothetical protein
LRRGEGGLRQPLILPVQCMAVWALDVHRTEVMFRDGLPIWASSSQKLIEVS